MKLFKAQIVDNTDFLEQGRLLVYAKDIADDAFYVAYVSPYSAHHEGGFVAIPEIGVQILIAQTEGSDMQWYYMGSIFGGREGIDESGNRSLEASDNRVPDREIYRARNKPQRIVIQDPGGNKLVLSHAYSPKYFNLKAELKSGLGKYLMLNDSPRINCIYLKNEFEDGIKITSGEQFSSAERAIEIESRGPQIYTSKESNLNFLVVDGREINIVNQSTGINAGDPNRFGNINIESVHNDINIKSSAEDGRIFLDALGQEGLIQIDSNGDVIIYASGDVKIRAGGNLQLKAESDIDIEAGGNLSLKGGGSNSLESTGVTNIKSGANMLIEGSKIDLNGPPAGSANSVSIDKEDNHYGD